MSGSQSMPEKVVSPLGSGSSLESVDARIQQLEYDNALLRASMECMSAENEAELRVFQDNRAQLTAAERAITELQSQKQEWEQTAESLRQELATALARTEELEDRLRMTSAHNSSSVASPDRASLAGSAGESSTDMHSASFVRSELTASLTLLREENQRLHDHIYMLEMDAVQQKALRKRERDHHSSAVRETAVMFADRVRELEALNRDNAATIQQLLDEIRRLEDTVDELSHSAVFPDGALAGKTASKAQSQHCDERARASSGDRADRGTDSDAGARALAADRSLPAAATAVVAAAGKAGGASWSFGGVSNSASPVCGDSDTDSGQHEGLASRSSGGGGGGGGTGDGGLIVGGVGDGVGDGGARGGHGSVGHSLDVDSSTLDAVRAARLLLSPKTRAALGFGGGGQPRVSDEGDSELQLQCLLASSEAAVAALQSDLARMRGLLSEREGRATALEAQLARARRSQDVQCLCLGGRCTLWPCRVLRQPLAASLPDRVPPPATLQSASSVALMPYGRRLSLAEVLQRLSDSIFVASCAGLAAASLSHPERLVVHRASIATVLSLSMLATFPLSGRALWLDALSLLAETCTGYVTDAMIGACC